MEKIKRQKEKVGTVISDKMHKTIVVRVVRLMRHKKYKKIIRKMTRFKAHDEKNVAKVGDKVLIQETRPLSKDKRWRLVKILESGK